MKPTEQEINETFDLIQDRLEEGLMSEKQNSQVRIGYENALNILDDTMQEHEIVNVKGVQASAIAMITFDYLKGECTQQILLGVPLKQSLIKPTLN